MSETLGQIEGKITGAPDADAANKWLQIRKELLAQEHTGRQARLMTWLTYLASGTVAVSAVLWVVKKLFFTTP